MASRSSRSALPLLLAAGAAALLVWLALGELGGDPGAEDFAREGSLAGPGEELTGSGGVALDGSGAPRPRPAPTPQDGVAGARPPAFPPEEGVAGRVLTARREPVAGAKVTLHAVPDVAVWGAADPAPAAETESAKDGSFLVGPAPAGRLKVRAVAPGFAPTVLAVPRRGTRIELVLDVGGALSVKAVDGAGAAVADASVLHTAGNWGMQVVSDGTTGADGSFTFASVPTGSGSVLVTKAGLGAARRHDVGVAPGETTQVVVVLRGGRELTGTITNAADKRAVAGAQIEVHYPWMPGLKPAAPTLSGEDGRYRTTVDLEVGEQFELRVTHPEFAELRQWLNYNDGGLGAMSHDLTLEQGVPGVSGRVVTREGNAAVGVEVSYGNQQPGQTFPRTVSGAEGRFELAAPAWGGPASSWLIVALHPTEGVGSVHAQLPQRNDPSGKAVEIRLSGAGRIAGLVRDAAGEPVSGAAVTAAPDWSALERGGRSSGRPMNWLVYQLLNDARVSGRLTAVSDAQGRFEIASVPTAIYQVTAMWGALQALHETPLEVQPGQEARAELVLSEGQTIQGRVLDAEERPVAGATVWGQPTRARPGASVSYPNARSQSDGRFTLFNVGSGPYQLQAQAAGFAQGQLAGVEPGTRDALLRLRALGWIEGQVLHDNVPYAGTFQVSARGESGAASEHGNLRGKESSQVSQTFNDPEGRFVLRGLPNGEHQLTASTAEGLIVLEKATVTVVEGRGAGPVRLVLHTGSTLVGEVEGADGRPLQGAWLWAQPAAGGEGPAAGARTDRAGSFRVRGLGAGEYRLTVSTEHGVTWSETADLPAAGERRVRLREQPPGRVRFTVLGPDDAPLAKARPTLHDVAGNEIHANWQLLRREGVIDGRTQDSWERATTTDGAGQCLRLHVPPGRYRAGAALAGYETAGEAVWIEVGPGALTDVTVVLSRTP